MTICWRLSDKPFGNHFLSIFRISVSRHSSILNRFLKLFILTHRYFADIYIETIQLPSWTGRSSSISPVLVFEGFLHHSAKCQSRFLAPAALCARTRRLSRAAKVNRSDPYGGLGLAKPPATFVTSLPFPRNESIGDGLAGSIAFWQVRPRSVCA